MKDENSRAAGLEKAAEIARYHRERYGAKVSPGYAAGCTDIEVSCLATALRIRRGEYENPTSVCMDLSDETPLPTKKGGS